MDESKSVSITLDKNSIEILKQVDNIHKSSLINLAISLISKTGYYKTLTGNIGNSLESITSLDPEGSVSANSGNVTMGAVVKESVPEKKKSNSWDDF